MKYFTSFSIAVSLFVPLVLPMSAAAQTTSVATTTAASPSSRLYSSDGSGETRTARRERIRGYRQQSSDLQQRIAALGATSTAAVSMPVLFGVTLRDISPNFGDPRSDGRTHEGEDIMAAKGTPIVSPTAAVVLRTGTGATEGNYVYTANPGGEIFVYMHLDRVGEGVVVGALLSEGSLVGYVGDTGNALGGPAHLHFEIHDNSNNPVDPFPRLTVEVSLPQKIADLFSIMAQTTTGTEFARFLVTNFRSTFNEALAMNIVLPLPIMDALASVPIGATPTPVGGAITLPAGDLDLGSSGAAVVALQKYLIQSLSGPAAVRLSIAGATGNFGPLTQTALIEYQVAAKISPATGYYGATTRAAVAAHPLGIPRLSSPATPTTPPATGSGLDAGIPRTPPKLLIRDLKQGMSGEDVRSLQKFLNAHGHMVALSGVGSVGNESTYFGPATLAAVIKFQIAQHISPTAGYVGPVTRAAIFVLAL